MLNGLPKLFGKIPLGAVAMVSNIIELIHYAGDKLMGHIASIMSKSLAEQDFSKTTSEAIRNGMTKAEGESESVA